MTHHVWANQLDERAIGVSRDNQAALVLTVITLAQCSPRPVN